MAQSLSDRTPSFLLKLFGTDNRFTHTDVLDRWKTMNTEAEKYGIKIMGYSSDGDNRLLKAMRLTSNLPSNSRKNLLVHWKWFNTDLGDSKNDSGIC